MKYGENLGAVTCILKVFQSGLRLYISDLSDNLNISNGLICDWVALRVLCARFFNLVNEMLFMNYNYILRINCSRKLKKVFVFWWLEKQLGNHLVELYASNVHAGTLVVKV